jgi:hypothetical protein
MNLGIYIQVPFCQTKCTYCNFHTGVASPAAYAPYARAVAREIRDWRALHAAAGLEDFFMREQTLGSQAALSDLSKSCHSEERFAPREGRGDEESAFAFNVAPGFSPASVLSFRTLLCSASAL